MGILRPIRSIKTFASTHKIWSALILIVIVSAGYYSYKSLTSTSGETRYVLATAQTGTVIASVTGSGQVSASNQIDLKPKVSGDIVYALPDTGQTVTAGTLIAQIDATDAQKTVRDAQTALDSAKLALAKLQEPPDQLSLTQAQSDLAAAQATKQSAQAALTKAYDDGFTSVANAYLDLPNIMNGLKTVLFSNNFYANSSNLDAYVALVQSLNNTAISAQVQQYRDRAYAAYQAALQSYNQNFTDYKASSRAQDQSATDALIYETEQTAKLVTDAVKSANNLIAGTNDILNQNNGTIPPLVGTQLTTVQGYTTTMNSHLTDLLNITNNIASQKQAYASADRDIAIKTQSLAKLQAGADPLDIQAQQIAITQKQNALTDAQENLANYFIRAPFDGTVAKMDVRKADNVSGGTVIATLITKQQLAQISLNEVDAAKIQVGQKATLTFDAVDGLSISGKVAEIDTVGTVSQGVVTYAVKISFDTQDDRVKPGMSVNAAIITDVRTDVLTVPNSAIKTQGNNNYVEIFDPASLSAAQTSQSQSNQGVLSATPPRQQPVQIGLADDTSTEITSGLKAGDLVVTRTITSSTPTAQTQAPSLFGGGGGGGVRVPGVGGRGN